MSGQLQRTPTKKVSPTPTATARPRSARIQRINAAARQYGLTYSQLMGRLAKQNIGLNRKVLADLAMNNPQAFEAIVKSVK